MDMFYAIVKFFVEGGPFMLPILFVGAVGTAIAIERYVSLTRMSVRNRNVWVQVEPALANGDFDKARELTSKDESAIARLLSMGLALQGAVRRRDDVKTAMQERMTEIMPQLEKRTHYLATLANVATLLGLLGTVSGLISAFAAVATVNPAEKANLLSASISEAMNCTAFGLFTGIIGLAAFAYLNGKTQNALDDIAEVRKNVSNLLYQAKAAMQG